MQIRYSPHEQTDIAVREGLMGYGHMVGRDDRVNDLTFNSNGERRKNGDRRQFVYTIHIPERRSGTDRRSDSDRRNKSRHSPNE